MVKHTVFLIVSIAFILSCGGSADKNLSFTGEGSAIAPRIQWDYRPASNGNTHLHKVPLGVYRLRVTVLDTNNSPVSGLQKTKDVAPGESGTIVFSNAPPGTYNIKLDGYDATGSNILYSGQTNNVIAEAGKVAEPTVIARYTRSDNASPGSSNRSPADGAANIPANTQITVQVSDADAGVDAASIALTVNNEDVTGRCSVLGTSDNYTVIYTPSTALSGTVTVTLRVSDLANPANSMATETWSFTIASGGTTDTTAPINPAISFSSTTTSSQVVTPTISASDDTGITGYYLTESSTTPSVTSSGWTSVTSTASYSANVDFTLSSGNGTKTVYVWFKDAAGNISGSASAAVTLNQTDTTAPTSTSVSINSGSSSTTTTSVTLTLSATDTVGVTGYYLSESSIAPSLTSTGWIAVSSATSYSSTAAFTLSGGSIGDNTKTVYVWFRDAAGNISAAASDSITLTISDSTAPSSPSVSINSGATSTTSTSATLALSATDNVGVTAYYASESSTTPSASATGWTAITSTTSYSAAVNFTLSSGEGTKTVNVWFKDAAGNISIVASDSITLTTGAAPSAPTGITATAGNGRVTISWTAVTGATSYNIYWSISSGVTKTTGTKISNATSPYSHTGLTNGTTYYYVITAVNSYGESSESVQVLAIPVLPPTPPDTNQNTCYSASGTVISCVGTGQDGEYTINAPSYSDNGNGTITDNVTGLTWQKQDDATTRNWTDAGTYCTNLSLAGTGWRLPTEFELMTIVDYGTFAPSINVTYFPNTQLESYWSSTPSAYFTGDAMSVYFIYGYVDYSQKTRGNYVRCVRGISSAAGVYTDNGNGTVTDNVTTLVWQKQDDAITKSWEQALTYCEGLSLGGFTDWRLSNVKELRSIADSSLFNPSINTTYFPNTQSSYYWSSTTDANGTTYAWAVGFIHSIATPYTKTSNLYGRCVRGGQ